VQAQPGDRIVIKSHHIGMPERDCEVLEVHGTAGAPPYVVRWGDTGQEGLFFPGSDAAVAPYDDAASPRAS
jgi:Domain of unknown function (DUF1918)